MSKLPYPRLMIPGIFLVLAAIVSAPWWSDLIKVFSTSNSIQKNIKTSPLAPQVKNSGSTQLTERLIVAPISPITINTYFAAMEIEDEALTELQKDLKRKEFFSQHKLRRVEWEANVISVSFRDELKENPYFVIFKPKSERGGKPKLWVGTCSFSSEWRNDLMTLRSGQKIIFSGILSEQWPLGPSLKDCHLIKVPETTP